MEKLMKVHMAVIIAILVFTLGILGFFLVQFIDKVNVMSTQLNVMETNTSVLINDVTWIKTYLVNENRYENR